ncbi:MAG: ribulose-phosphate 3-epimerase [Candidatus Syntrophosphaera sp.]|nr:ribulose-phosphate 3-epimerase [Candidatus Syntrophosphaera sp.]
MKKILIAPSILSSDFGRLEQELAALSAANLLHLDIMDGHYVPNLTFGDPLIRKVRQLSSLPLDAHLMVTNPASYVDRLAEIGVNWISFHQECEYHSHRLVQRIKEHGIKAGIALNPAVPVSSLECILPDLDYVLLMSVNPGFSGQKFIPSVLDKVAALRELIDSQNLSALIEVDGGVNAELAPRLIAAGADILVSASYVFSSPDYTEAIQILRGN